MIFKNGNVLLGDFKFHKVDMIVENGIFVDFVSGENSEGINLEGKYIVPGLIDVHIHGANACQLGEDDDKIMERMSEYLVRRGTTTFVPSISCCAKTTLLHNIEQIKTYKQNGAWGTAIGGIHLEGPYFSMNYKGAQKPEYIRKPDVDEFCKLQEASGDEVRIISMAPEISGALEFIEEVSKDCVVSIGHTDSDYDTAMKAIEKGASHMTHTFNGMRPFKHREPNALGAAFDSDITCECICDGIHLHPATVRTLYKIVGPERLVFISDGCRQVGMQDGEYDFGGRKLIIKEGKATMADGTIDGGCYTLLHNVRCAIEFGIPVEDAFRCASLNPSKVIKKENKIGSIDKGKYADFLVLDEEYQLCDVYKRGKLIL